MTLPSFDALQNISGFLLKELGKVTPTLEMELEMQKKQIKQAEYLNKQLDSVLQEQMNSNKQPEQKADETFEDMRGVL